MAIGISPLVDFAFKLMLGSPKHARVTIHFLNSILVDQPRITQVKFLNPILDKESADDKLSVLDILATDEHQRLLNIEMQTSLPSSAAEFPSGERTDRVYCNSCGAMGVVPSQCRQSLDRRRGTVISRPGIL